MKKLIDIIEEEKTEKESISTEFKQFDKITQDFKKSGLIYIAARPGMGKTTFEVNLAENIAKTGKKCAFFSLELSDEQLAEKFSTINSDMEIYIDDTHTQTVSEIKQKILDLKNVDCVIIDYLSLIAAETTYDNNLQGISKISYQLKQMAKELNMFVICTIQLPAYEGKPSLRYLMDSGAMVQDADVLMFLHRDKFTIENMDNCNSNITELIIAKNRYGDIGTINLKYNSKTNQFTEI